MTKAVAVELLGDPKGCPIEFIVRDAAAIEKGSILKLSGARIAEQTVVADLGVPIAGIAVAEKVASDGSTTLACYTKGVFDVIIDNAGAFGDVVEISGADTFTSNNPGELSGSQICGRLLETATAGAAAQVAFGIY